MQILPSLFALRALEAAARNQSYSAAARELGVTQGAVSQQIRRLEAEFGAILFQRRGNEMIPTTEAKSLASEVALAIGRLRAAVGAFSDALERGPLVLSVDNRFASRWLAPKMSRLFGAPAGASLNVRVEDRVANFTTDGVDFAVRFGRGDWPGLNAERLTTDRFYVVCTPEFARKHNITEPKDLLRVPLVHSPDRPWSLVFDRWRLPTPPANWLVADDSILVLDTVGRGEAAALVRSSMADDDLRHGRLVRPIQDAIPLPANYVQAGRLVRAARASDPPLADYGYFLVWPTESPKQRRIHAVRDLMIAEARASEQADATPDRAKAEEI